MKPALKAEPTTTTAAPLRRRVNPLQAKIAPDPVPEIGQDVKPKRSVVRSTAIATTTTRRPSEAKTPAPTKTVPPPAKSAPAAKTPGPSKTAPPAAKSAPAAARTTPRVSKATKKPEVRIVPPQPATTTTTTPGRSEAHQAQHQTTPASENLDVILNRVKSLLSFDETYSGLAEFVRSATTTTTRPGATTTSPSTTEPTPSTTAAQPFFEVMRFFGKCFMRVFGECLYQSFWRMSL